MFLTDYIDFMMGCCDLKWDKYRFNGQPSSLKSLSQATDHVPPEVFTREFICVVAHSLAKPVTAACSEPGPLLVLQTQRWARCRPYAVELRDLDLHREGCPCL